MALLLRVRENHGRKSSWEEHYLTYILRVPQDAGEELMTDRGLEVGRVSGGPAATQGVTAGGRARELRAHSSFEER